MKIVVLGSLRFGPYEILDVPKPVCENWHNEEGYRKATERIHPAIQACDEVWVYAPDGVGEHTSRDLEYAKKLGKKSLFLRPKNDRGWLTDEQWETFSSLFEIKEGTNWYDTRELAFTILGHLSPKCEEEARRSNESITTILQVIDMALNHKLKENSKE